MGIILSTGLGATAKMLFNKAKREKAEYEEAIRERDAQMALANSYREQVQKISDNYAKQQEAITNLMAKLTKEGDHADIFPGMVFGGDLNLWAGTLDPVKEQALKTAGVIAKGVNQRGLFKLTLHNKSEYRYKITSIMVDDIKIVADDGKNVYGLTVGEAKPEVVLKNTYIAGQVDEVRTPVYYNFFGLLNVKVANPVANYIYNFAEIDIAPDEAVTVTLNPAFPFDWVINGEEIDNSKIAYYKAKLKSGRKLSFNLLCYYTIEGDNNLLQNGQWIPYLSSTPIEGVLTYIG